MNVLVLGGTGVISRAIVNLLLKKEHKVTVFNRGSRTLSFEGPVRQITGDRGDRSDFESRMRQESFDAVIDMICFNEADARSTVAAFKDNSAQIVVCSSVAAYKRPYNSVPTVESAESLYDDPTFGYALDKAQVERYLQEEIRFAATSDHHHSTIAYLRTGCRQYWGFTAKLRNHQPHQKTKTPGYVWRRQHTVEFYLYSRSRQSICRGARQSTNVWSSVPCLQ